MFIKIGWQQCSLTNFVLKSTLLSGTQRSDLVVYEVGETLRDHGVIFSREA